MYRIDRRVNDVVKLKERLFKDLHFRERDHLQEWIAKNPDMLGEDLLIIQKEYDGFNDTNERLDLLALDKQGNIVVIENKLDDSGRNVVWQALKYASYCSTLTTQQIIKIYQEFLDRSSIDLDAKENLLEYIEGDEEELFLNRGDQRIIFVANHYRKEVTSTVLWLLDHDVQIQCMKVTPYSMGEELFLQIDQIIPVPETEEFMIDAKEKEKEEKSRSKTVVESDARLIRFWGLLKNDLKAHNIDFLERVSAKPYYDMGFSKGQGRFAFCIGRKGYRVELYIPNDAEKVLFDSMYEHHESIEKQFDGEITWQRLDGKKASRIKHEMPKSMLDSLEGKFNEELFWDILIKWYRESMVRLYEAIYPFWETVQRDI